MFSSAGALNELAEYVAEIICKIFVGLFKSIFSFRSKNKERAKTTEVKVDESDLSQYDPYYVFEMGIIYKDQRRFRNDVQTLKLALQEEHRREIMNIFTSIMVTFGALIEDQTHLTGLDALVRTFSKRVNEVAGGDKIVRKTAKHLVKMVTKYSWIYRKKQTERAA